MDNKIKELDEFALDIISDYKENGKLHPDFMPFPTYDMVQCGYPFPNEGIMIARAYGGVNKEDILLPSTGMWCKVEDVRNLLEENGLSFNNNEIRRNRNENIIK